MCTPMRFLLSIDVGWFLDAPEEASGYRECLAAGMNTKLDKSP